MSVNTLLTRYAKRRIILEYNPFKVTQENLAARFGLGRSTVERVLKGRTKRLKPKRAGVAQHGQRRGTEAPIP